MLENVYVYWSFTSEGIDDVSPLASFVRIVIIDLKACKLRQS